MKIPNILIREPRKTPQDFIKIVDPFVKQCKEVYQDVLIKSPNFTDMEISSTEKSVIGAEISTHAPDFNYVRVKTPKMDFAIDLENNIINFNEKPFVKATKKAYIKLKQIMDQFNSSTAADK